MFQSVCKWSHIGLPFYGKISFLGLKLKGLVGKYESIMIMITVCELLIQIYFGTEDVGNFSKLTQYIM